jgi:hypothetical protein
MKKKSIKNSIHGIDHSKYRQSGHNVASIDKPGADEISRLGLGNLPSRFVGTNRSIK